MKKILLGTVLLCSMLSFGQLSKIELEKPIETFKVEPMGKLEIKVDKYSEYVSFMFRDTKYSTLTRFEHFKLTKEDFDSLGKLLLSPDNKVDDMYTISTSENGKLYIVYRKSLGYLYPDMTWFDNAGNLHGMRYLTSKQIEKLFKS